MAFHYQGKFDDAITQYEKALELDPNNDMAASNLGMIAREQGDIAGAAKWAQRTMDINKSVPQSAANMASLYIEVGEDEMAEEIIDEGIAAHPDAPDLQAMKGTLSMRNGNLVIRDNRTPGHAAVARLQSVSAASELSHALYAPGRAGAGALQFY